MREYNDYANMIRSYLRRYSEFQTTVKNLRALADAHRMELDVGAPIAKYGDDPAGGTSALTVVEREASRRARLTREIERAESDARTIETRLGQIENAVLALPMDESAILQDHYMKRKSWTAIAQANYITEGALRNKASQAIKRVASMVFGSKADMQGALFRLADL